MVSRRVLQPYSMHQLLQDALLFRCRLWHRTHRIHARPPSCPAPAKGCLTLSCMYRRYGVRAGGSNVAYIQLQNYPKFGASVQVPPSHRGHEAVANTTGLCIGDERCITNNEGCPLECSGHQKRLTRTKSDLGDGAMNILGHGHILARLIAGPVRKCYGARHYRCRGG